MITLLGVEFKYKIERKPIRSLRLKLEEANRLIIRSPWLVPQWEVEKFLKNNSEWIVKQSQKINKKRLDEIEELEVLGIRYQVLVNKFAISKARVVDEQKLIMISNYQALKKELRPWAVELIKKELTSLQKEFDFDYNRVKVSNQKTRFGSCSSRGNLNFNWQIIFFPKEKFRHIILHEVAHLKVKNHSRKFWELVAQFDQNWKENNKWLKSEGAGKFIV